jgi:plastocyanin
MPFFMSSLGMLTCCGLLATTVFAGDQPTTSALVLETDADGVQRAAMTLDSYAYAPNHLIVRVGKPVELTLTSVTVLTPHNFVIKEPAAGLVVDQNVSAGKSQTIRFTPEQIGVFTFYCDKKLLFFASHREKGMEGRLEVRQ